MQSFEQDHLLYIHEALVGITDRDRLHPVEIETRSNIGIPHSFEIARIQFLVRQIGNLLAKNVKY